MDTEKIKNNLRMLIKKNDALAYVFPKLAAANIRYGLYAGAHVAVLTNNRIPTDIDLLVHDDDLQKLQTLFPFAKTTDLGDGVFLYIGKDDVVEFMGAAGMVKDNTVYPFRLTDEAVARIATITVDGLEVNVVDPVDSILLKSILQRGADQGKHDLEDIKAVLQNVDIDTDYLYKRLVQAGALELARPVFTDYGIKLPA
jgi:predicted nucleotidyltransferase